MLIKSETEHLNKTNYNPLITQNNKLQSNRVGNRQLNVLFVFRQRH